MIGRYRLVEFIDEGGAAKVWKAEDTLLQIPVVIKLFPIPYSSNESRREEILREARNTARLDHPNIATALDAGEAEGELYIVLRYVEGETLASRLSRGPMPFREVARIGRAVAQALAHAHDNKVLHRDVTSRNVMIATDGQPRLIDFGLSTSQGTEILTTTGVIRGTLEFMSPEVAMGLRADVRSDLYGLGCVLYHLVAGSPPFGVGTETNILPRILREIPRPLRERREGTPVELERIVESLLAKRPADRFQTARDVDEALRALEASGRTERADEDELLRRSDPSRRTSRGIARFTRRLHRSLARLFVPPASGASVRWFVVRAAALVALLGLVWLAVEGRRFLHPAPQVRSVAVLPLRNISSEPEGSAYLAEGIGEAMVTRLSKVPGLRVLPWLTTQAYADTVPEPTRLGRELNVDNLLVGTFAMSSGRIHVTVALVDAKKRWQIWGDEFDEPPSDILTMQKNLALAVATSLKGRLSGEEEALVARAPTQSSGAYTDYLKGLHLLRDGDEPTTTLALDYFQRALRADSTLVEARVAAGAANTRRYFQGWEGGEASLAEAEADFRSALALDPSSAPAARGLIRVNWEHGDAEGCLRLGKALATQGRDDIEGLIARADAYFLGGLPEKAPPLLERVLAMDPRNEGAAWTLTIADMWAGKPRDALRAADRFTQAYGPDPEIEVWVAASYDILGQTRDALEHYNRAIESFGSDSNLYVFIFAAGAAARAGRAEESRRLLLEGLTESEERLAKNPVNWRIKNYEAIFLALLGQRARFEQALEAMRESGSPARFAADTEGLKTFSAQIAWGDTSGALQRFREAVKEIPIGLVPADGLERLLDYPGSLPPSFRPLVESARAYRARLAATY